MAVVTYPRKDLESLMGRKLDDKTIQRAAEMGAPVEELTEKEASFEVFPDRPDQLSIEGFVRAFGNFLSPKKRTYGFKTPKIKLKTDPSVKTVRPFIVAAVARDINLDEYTLISIMNFQEKIHETFGRKRKKLSIGIYDLDKTTPPFTYKAVDPKSVSFVPLDDVKKRTLDKILDEHPKGVVYASLLKQFKKYPLLVDAKDNVLSMPPIINSEDTRVEPYTKNLFIDITGTDLKTQTHALNILCYALIDRGAKVEKALIDGKPTPETKPKQMSVDSMYINKLLGLNLTTDQIIKLFTKMGLEVVKKKPLTVEIPPYRSDILHPIDLVEDVAIAYGYMNFTPAISETATIGTPLKRQKELSTIREIMIGNGFNEISTFALTNTQTQFQKMMLPEKRLVTIANPRTADYTHFRDSLLPSMMNAISINSRYELPQSFFEIGEIANSSGENETHIAAAIISDSASYSEIRMFFESLTNEIDGAPFKLTDHSSPTYIEGRVARVTGKFNGTIGEIHPQVLKNFGIEYPVAVFELKID